MVEVPALKIQCENELIWSVDVDNVVHLFEASKLYQACDLSVRCLEFFAQHVEKIKAVPKELEKMYKIIVPEDHKTLIRLASAEMYDYFKKGQKIHLLNNK
jgi:hypothetical protein